MIKHIVMWRLKDRAEGSDRAANARLVKEKLEALAGQIPGLLRLEVGIDFEGGDQAADVVLYSEFASREALAAYHHHPAHEAVKPFIAAVRSERRVVDYEAP